MRDKVQTMVIEMLVYHKDLQHLPTCQNLIPYLQAYFQVPERGLLNSFGTFEISTWGVTVQTWTNKRYRFKWNTITPYIQAHFSSKQLLLF